MDASPNSTMEQQFLQKMNDKVKPQMILKYFRQTDQSYLDVPLFTEYSGTKQIVPFRNTQCMTFKCIYDITELLVKYKNSAYSNYLNFICHTCRKMIDIQDFYKDIDLEKIINKIWMKHNVNDKVICSLVKIQRSGDWSPMLPNYARKLDKQMDKMSDPEEVNQISRYEENDDDSVALQNVEVYETIPMMDQFDVNEYKRLLSEFVNEDKPRFDNEIILKRYKQQMKWGEFTHIRGQTAFLQAPMAIFVSYLSDYYQRKVSGVLPIAFSVIKVTSYDSFRQRAQYYYISDNFQTLQGSIASNCRMAIFVMNFDERWMLVILNVQNKQIKLLDFLEDQISRYRQDELYEMSMFIVEEICPPIKIKRIYGQLQVERDQLNAKLIQEQIQELKKKVQYYTDCGLQLAQYLYYFVKQEIEVQSDQIPRVQTKVGEKDLFTARVCWLFLKMTLMETVMIPYYQFKPKVQRALANKSKSNKQEDSLDQFVRKNSQMSAKSSKRTLQSWDFNRHKNKNDNNVSNTVGNILQQMNQDKPQGMNVEKQQIRATKYWNMAASKADESQSQHLPTAPYSQQIPRSIIKNIVTPNQSSLIEQKQKEDPFFAMPRAQLQQLLEDYKQSIIKGFRQQTIAKQYFIQQNQGDQAMFNQIEQSTNEKQQIDMEAARQYEEYQALKLDGTINESRLDKDISRLKQELGIKDEDLEDMDESQYTQIMDLLESDRRVRK